MSCRRLLKRIDTTSYAVNHGDTPDHRLDGYRVLLVVYPAMTQTRLEPDPLDDGALGTKAYVVVDDPQEQQDTEKPREV